MGKTIDQSVVLNARARRLYDTYMDSKKHSVLIGAPVRIGREAGTPFSAFGGSIVGRTLEAVPGRLIVQTWRPKGWPAKVSDSILVLTFTDTPRGARINLAHANVPDAEAKMIASGWHSYYWRPWKAALKRKR
jgi:activator of HSP90 ATPase